MIALGVVSDLAKFEDPDEAGTNVFVMMTSSVGTCKILVIEIETVSGSEVVCVLGSYAFARHIG